MRKIIFVLLVLFCFAEIKAQNADKPKTNKTAQQIENEEHSETIDAKRLLPVNLSVKSTSNSTTTTLDSAGVFTGTAESVLDYSSISITVRSDSAGSYKVLFGNSSTITTATAIKTHSFSYTAGDTTHTKYIPVDGPYFKVVYTSSADTQHTFYLTTMLNKGNALPTTADGKVDVEVSGSALPSGAATAANQATHNTKLDSLIADIASILLKQINLSANSDSSLALSTPRVFQADSLVSADTASHNFNFTSLKGYITIYNSTAGADTVVIEHYSPTKAGWTNLAIGLRDQLTDLLEADNTTIIVAAGATKTYEINYFRPGNIRVRWKTNTGKSASNKAYLGFTGVN